MARGKWKASSKEDWIEKMNRLLDTIPKDEKEYGAYKLSNISGLSESVISGLLRDLERAKLLFLRLPQYQIIKRDKMINSGKPLYQPKVYRAETYTIKYQPKSS